jgi:hypothetical protein
MTHEEKGISGAKDIVLTPDFIVGNGQLYFIRLTTGESVSIQKILSGN